LRRFLYAREHFLPDRANNRDAPILDRIL